MKKGQQNPIAEAIYVTLGAKQIEEKKGGWRTYVTDFEKCDGERAVYYWRLSTKPKREFTHVYIVVGNKVRFRATFIGYDEKRKVDFLDGSELYGDIWLQLIDFIQLPKPYEVKRGFQGFRYKNG